jgi:hypothetical protein
MLLNPFDFMMAFCPKGVNTDVDGHLPFVVSILL